VRTSWLAKTCGDGCVHGAGWSPLQRGLSCPRFVSVLEKSLLCALLSTVCNVSVSEDWEIRLLWTDGETEAVDTAVHDVSRLSVLRGQSCLYRLSEQLVEFSNTILSLDDGRISSVDKFVHSADCVTSECRPFCPYDFLTSSFSCWEAPSTQESWTDDDKTFSHVVDGPCDLWPSDVILFFETEHKFLGLTGFCGLTRPE